MKYIIFDLDDTVLVKGVASNKTIETFSKCQKLGHKIIINTARSLPYGKKYIEIFNADYAILNAKDEKLLEFSKKPLLNQNNYPFKLLLADTNNTDAIKQEFKDKYG